ncbi:MAG: peptidylprolyl isomerase [Lachnospiraceae bacterium]|nr:peptidylprolyl isomerase [Lachnospiraceae bacterium]
MKKAIRNITCALSAVMCLGLVSGCSCRDVYFTTGLSDNDIFKIDGVATSRQEAMLYLTCEKNLYETSYGSEIWEHEVSEGTTLTDYVKNIVKERLAQVSALNQLAKKNKITLSEKEEKKIKRAAQAFYEGLSDEEIEYMDIELEDVDEAYSKYALAEKVYSELTKDIEPEVSDADALVIKVQSIYIKTYSVDAEGNITEYSKEEKKDAKQKAKDLLSQVKEEDADFYEIASKYSDAEEVEYVFGKGEMVEEFEEAAYLLKDDQISKLVTTDTGYYIIKCIEDYMIEETQANKESIIAQEKDKGFKEVYEPFLDSVTSEFNDKVWNEIDFKESKNVTTCNFYDIYNSYMSE